MPRVTAPQPDHPFALIEATGETRFDEIDKGATLDMFKAHGALLFRGFGADLDSFRRFAASFCTGSVFNESPDRLLLDAAHNVQSVNGGAEAFPLHPELSREPWKPDVCFFHCLVPPAGGGGETTICDGIALVDHLPEDVRAGFARHRLVYLQFAPPWQLQFWFGTETPNDAQLAAPPPACPYSFARFGGDLARIFSRPALHRPMFADGPAFGNFLLFARYFNGHTDFPLLDDGREVPDAWVAAAKAAGGTLSVPIAWQTGDLLMLDNSRFLHGRNAITDPDRRLIASYFGYLKDAPHNPEEPADPIWRRGDFRPPMPPRANL